MYGGIQVKKILILLGSCLFLFSTILVTASATQIPVVGEYDYGNLEFHSLIDTYEWKLVQYSDNSWSDEVSRYETSTTSPSFRFTSVSEGYYDTSLYGYLSQSVYVEKFYLTLALSDLSFLPFLSYVSLYYNDVSTEAGMDIEFSELTEYDRFFHDGYYYLCFSFDVTGYDSGFPNGLDVNTVCLQTYIENVSLPDGFISIVQWFTTSSLTYPIKDSAVSIYSTPSGAQTPGTFELKHNIYGYPWELTVEDDRPQSIYFDRQQGLMTQSIIYDYGRDTFIDKMKIVYFIVGDNPRFGVSVLSQDDYGSIISSVPEFKVETGISYPMAPVEWNGDNIMPDYYEITIDLKGYNLEDCTINISCLVDALEDPNPNNANRINYFFFFGNFIGYYTKDLSQAEDPNLKWVTFIGDKLDSLLEYFKQPEVGNDVIDNIGSSVDEYHDLEQGIIDQLPDLDFAQLPDGLYYDFDESGQQNQFFILSTIANKPSIARLIIISCLLGVVACVLFIKRQFYV